MSELNVNDYVRTKQKGLQPPQIAKIKSMKRDEGYNNQYYIELDHNLLPDYNLYIYEEDIAKTSPRVIDLIEIGDYVNGGIVKEINKHFIRMNGTKKLLFQFIDKDKPEDIKSIVTKESFENISYKVGE
jgi:hypothetical protein